MLVHPFLFLVLEVALFGMEAPQDSLLILRVEQGAQRGPQPVGFPPTFGTLTEAIEAAAPGADIYIEPGKYYEAITIDKPLHLLGSLDSPSEIIVSEGPYAAIEILADAVVDGLYIRADRDITEMQSPPVGISVRSPAQNVTIRSCVIENTDAAIEPSGTTGKISIENNHLMRSYFGVGAPNNEGSISCIGNEIVENQHGVFASESNIELVENTVSRNLYGIKIATRNESKTGNYAAVLRRNTVKENKAYGIWYDQGTARLTTSLDMGASGMERGDNTIGESGVYDLFNETHGLVETVGNTWSTSRVANLYEDGEVAFFASEAPGIERPRIKVSVTPNEIRPSASRMVSVKANVAKISPQTDLTATILAAVVDEYWVGRQDDSKDIDDADIGKPDFEFRVRSTPSEIPGEKRMYTVTYLATDDKGNSVAASASTFVKERR